MAVYKYLRASTIGVLESGRIRFTQPRYLNDPFELLPHFKELMPESVLERELVHGWPDAVRRALASLPPNAVLAFSVADVLSAPWRNRRTLLARLRQQPALDPIAARDRLYEWLDGRIGILSLSRKADDILMWSHYTGSHRGFVLELDETHEYFHGEHPANSLFGKLLEVTYLERRPHMSAADLDQLQLFLAKSSRWAYEDEVRMIRPLEDANEMRTDGEERIHLYDFPGDALMSVICGSLMEPQVQRQVVEVVEQHARYTHVRIDKMVVDETTFQVRRVPIDEV